MVMTECVLNTMDGTALWTNLTRELLAPATPNCAMEYRAGDSSCVAEKPQSNKP
jgi:hypothetical protein